MVRRQVVVGPGARLDGDVCYVKVVKGSRVGWGTAAGYGPDG